MPPVIECPFEEFVFALRTPFVKARILRAGADDFGHGAPLLELAFVLRTPFVKERYGVLSIELVGNSPREFFEQVREDLARWKPVVAAVKITVD